MADGKQYIVPNRPQPQTVIVSQPIRDNLNTIEDALNANYELAKDVVNKVDNEQKGSPNGVASLDDVGKIPYEQVPESVKSHIYEVNSMQDMYSIIAYTGDIFVVRDIEKTYCYSLDSSGNPQYIEIATKNGGGTVAGNTCYVRTITEDIWQVDNIKSNYFIEIPEVLHGQGTTKYIMVNIKREDGQVTNCDYFVDDNGLVRITSDVRFAAKLMISNLSGNVKNSSFIPYCVLDGNRNNNTESLFNTRGKILELDVSRPIILVDGYNIARTIKSVTENVTKNMSTEELRPFTTTSTEQYPKRVTAGESYVIFIDSLDITRDENLQDTGVLTDIKFTEKENYLGVLNELPPSGIKGQRCYIIYDKSYEYNNDNWVPTPFTPIGELYIESDYYVYRDFLITYPYRQNNINVNVNSTCFDYLIGDQITGLEINIDTNIQVSRGNCYGLSRIITLNNDLTRQFFAWGKNAQTGRPDLNIGCIDLDSFKNTTTVYEIKNVLNDNIYYTLAEGNRGTLIDSGVQIYESIEAISQEGTAIETLGNDYTYTGNTYTPDSLASLNAGWGYIYLISRTNFTDLLLSFDEEPNLPKGYDQYRRIGYFYREQSDYIDLENVADTHITKQRYINGITYFKTPQNVDTIIHEDNTQGILSSVPEDVPIIINVKSEAPQELEFYYNNTFSNNDNDIILINSSFTRNITLELPQDFTFTGENVTVRVLGYRDERKSWQ